MGLKVRNNFYLFLTVTKLLCVILTKKIRLINSVTQFNEALIFNAQFVYLYYFLTNRCLLFLYL